MRVFLLLISTFLITSILEAQEEPESSVSVQEDFEIKPPTADQAIDCSQNSSKTKTGIHKSPKKIEFEINEIEVVNEDESTESMSGVLRAIGFASICLMGSIIGLFATIWLCIRGKKSFELAVN